MQRLLDHEDGFGNRWPLHCSETPERRGRNSQIRSDSPSSRPAVWPGPKQGMYLFGSGGL